MKESENIGFHNNEEIGARPLTREEYFRQNQDYWAAIRNARMLESIGKAIKVPVFDEKTKELNGFYYEDTDSGEILIYENEKDRREELKKQKMQGN